MEHDELKTDRKITPFSVWAGLKSVRRVIGAQCPCCACGRPTTAATAARRECPPLRTLICRGILAFALFYLLFVSQFRWDAEEAVDFVHDWAQLALDTRGRVCTTHSIVAYEYDGTSDNGEDMQIPSIRNMFNLSAAVYAAQRGASGGGRYRLFVSESERPYLQACAGELASINLVYVPH
jgi:hypothetical protein